jgi:hypothetical protein
MKGTSSLSREPLHRSRRRRWRVSVISEFDPITTVLEPLPADSHPTPTMCGQWGSCCGMVHGREAQLGRLVILVTRTTGKDQMCPSRDEVRRHCRSFHRVKLIRTIQNCCTHSKQAFHISLNLSRRCPYLLRSQWLLVRSESNHRCHDSFPKCQSRGICDVHFGRGISWSPISIGSAMSRSS